MKKGLLYLILVTCTAMILCCVFVYGLYYTANVEILTSHYPVYDLSQNKYILKSKKPENWVKLKEVSHLAKWSIIVSEDWAFYEHNGLDLRQLKIVLKESLEEQELGRGASTITQQVIKNSLLSNERSIWRKAREMFLAYKVEKVLSKDKILEIYLNIIELGDGIYGIKAASKHYFNKLPIDLTAREGAFLAMLLPSPVKYSYSFKQRELTDFAREQISNILLKLKQAHIYNEEDRLDAESEVFWWEPQNIKAWAPSGTPYAEAMDSF